MTFITCRLLDLFEENLGRPPTSDSVFGSWDVHPRDRPVDHQLLDLLGSFGNFDIGEDERDDFLRIRCPADQSEFLVRVPRR